MNEEPLTLNTEKRDRIWDRQSAVWLWLFPVAETLHNVEEAIGLPAWMEKLPNGYPQIGWREFAFATVIITLLVYLATWIGFHARPQSRWLHFFSAVAAGVGFNVFIPHLAGTLVTGSYMPGLASGLALNVPIAFILLRHLLKKRYISLTPLFLWFIAINVAIYALLPILFALGRLLLTCSVK